MKLLIFLPLATLTSALPSSPSSPSSPISHPAPRALDFSVDAGTPNAAYSSRPSFSLTITEFCSQLKMEAGAEFETDDGRFKDSWDFNFVAEAFKGINGGVKVEKLSGGRLGMEYDYARHVVKYTYGTCSFDSESRDPNGCGFCEEAEGWSTPWSGPLIDCSKRAPEGQGIMVNTRTRFDRCWVTLANAKRDEEEDVEKTEVSGVKEDNDLPKREILNVGDEVTKIAARANSISTVSSTLPSGPPIVTTEWKPRDYATFRIDVVEYCRDKKLTARGVFRTEGSIGEQFEFEDGHTIVAVNVGYNNLLHVGVYELESSLLYFGFGDCKWDQDYHSADYCGYCIPGKWTQEDELKCDENADGGRNHGMDCFFILDNAQKSKRSRPISPGPAPPSPR